MDQIFQLQRQIQELRQEVNNISQFAGQLQRSEANNAAQLQRLQQNEVMATQQLQTIQQFCNRLNQDVNNINAIAQQIGAQVMSKPLTTGQFGANLYGVQPLTGQYGANVSPWVGTGVTGTQFGTFGAQFANQPDQYARNQQISALAANRYGLGQQYPNEFAANQHISGMVSQPAWQQQGMFGAGAGTGAAGWAGMNVSPISPATTPGAAGWAGMNVFPVSPAATPGTPGWAGTPYTAQYSPALTGSQNIGRYSNF